MFGLFLFWIHYIIAGLLLYTLLRCSYKYVEVKDKDSWRTRFEKSNEKAKFPLWLILLFIIAFFIPVINLITIVSYMAIMAGSEIDNRIYYKSFLTKEY
jgi:hypothetical protein